MGRGEGGTRTSVLPAHFGNFAASKLAIGARDCRSDAARRKSRKHRHSCQDNSRGTPDIFAILRASPPGYDHVTGVAQNEADPPRLTVQYEKKSCRSSRAQPKCWANCCSSAAWWAKTNSCPRSKKCAASATWMRVLPRLRRRRSS